MSGDYHAPWADPGHDVHGDWRDALQAAWDDAQLPAAAGPLPEMVFYPGPRRMSDGHRVPDDRPAADGGLDAVLPVIATRSLHPLLWPFEITGRLEARLRGWLVRRRGSWYR